MEGNGVPGHNPAMEPPHPKTVQEMSATGVEPPKEYIVRDNKFGQLDTCPPLAPIPVIDLSLFSSGEEEEGELEKLRSALSSWGCFQATGHGMPSQFLDEVRKAIREIFKLPGKEKSKYSRAAGESEEKSKYSQRSRFSTGVADYPQDLSGRSEETKALAGKTPRF